MRPFISILASVFVIIMVSACASTVIRVPISQDKIAFLKGNTIQLESLPDQSKIINAVGVAKFENSTIFITKADSKGNVNVEGALAITESGIIGIMHMPPNQIVTVNSMTYKCLFCVGKIKIAPNLTVPLSIYESISSGSEGAVFKRFPQGKGLELIDGEAFLLINKY